MFHSRWWRTKKSNEPPIRIVIYSRAQCPCCDDATELLRELSKEFPLTIETIDVDRDEELKRAHGDWVPVVVINGQVRFRGRVPPAMLRRELQLCRRGSAPT